MKGIIVLEGPDGAGKSYFAKYLISKYGGVVLHQKYKFKNKIDLYYMAVFKKALKLSQTQLVILDRFHISEIIYGEIFRNGSKCPWILKYYNEMFNILNIPIILCIPRTVEQGNRWFNCVKNQRDEMYQDIQKVIKLYINYSKKNPQLLTYNKEEAENSEEYIMGIIEKIKEKLCTN